MMLQPCDWHSASNKNCNVRVVCTYPWDGSDIEEVLGKIRRSWGGVPDANPEA